MFAGLSFQGSEQPVQETGFVTTDGHGFISTANRRRRRENSHGRKQGKPRSETISSFTSLSSVQSLKPEGEAQTSTVKARMRPAVRTGIWPGNMRLSTVTLAKVGTARNFQPQLVAPKPDEGEKNLWSSASSALKKFSTPCPAPPNRGREGETFVWFVGFVAPPARGFVAI